MTPKGDSDILHPEEFQEMQPNPIQSCKPCREATRACPECNFRTKNLTPQERQSVEFMEERMEHDVKENVI